MNAAVAPGSIIGVLGSGQLGRMFAIAARRLGYRVHVLSPDDDTPTGQVADEEIQARYDDLEAVSRFARNVAVVTFEFENVPSEAIAACARHVPVFPSGEVLYTTQQRAREKTFLQQQGFPVPGFAVVRSAAELDEALRQLRCPAVLKTAAWGYDGKGQARIPEPTAARDAWDSLGTDEAVVEQYVDFQCELSVIVARGRDGSACSYGPMLNHHRRHILDVSLAPAPIDDRLVREADRLGLALAVELDVVGVVCVEMFLTRDDRLLVNEIAPRPHNSGHLTIDAHATCQFEQQVRAVCGLPLGSAEQYRPAAMANLLGDLWLAGPLDWPAALADPGVKLHLYGKREAKPGRKMGHFTVVAERADAAEAMVRNARQRLAPGKAWP